MKANELRIGNLLEYQMDDAQDERKRWWEIFKVDCQDFGTLEKYPDSPDFRPIHLTEEWFIKFGAKKDDLEYDCYILSSLTVDYRFTKITCLDGSFYWVCDKVLGDTFFIYVHQLQNLYFALTGNELIYENSN